MPAIIRFLGYNPLPPGKGWAARLVQCRTVLRLSQKEQAAGIGVDPCILARWERGEYKPAGNPLAHAWRFVSAAEAMWSPVVARTAQSDFARANGSKSLLEGVGNDLIVLNLSVRIYNLRSTFGLVAFVI